MPQSEVRLGKPNPHQAVVGLGQLAYSNVGPAVGNRIDHGVERGRAFDEFHRHAESASNLAAKLDLWSCERSAAGPPMERWQIEASHGDSKGSLVNDTLQVACRC